MNGRRIRGTRDRSESVDAPISPAERLTFRRAIDLESARLTDISLRSKGVWGYDSRFMSAVRDVMTIDQTTFGEVDLFVAEQGGRVVGFYGLSRDRPLSWIEYFLIDPSVLRSGVGRALWRHLESTASELDVSRLRVLADPHARGFYEAMGMRHVGDAPSDVFGPTRPLPVLEKQL